MSLDRQREVMRFWNWLPAFRAVAEYESLQRAALALSISPSALSRTIRCLEDALETSLFVRSPGGVTLTTRGARLLEATRDAMRRVHDSLPDGVEPVRCAATSPVLEAVLFEGAREALFDCGFTLIQLAPERVEEALRCGEVDAVLQSGVPDAPGVTELPALEIVLAWRGVARERVGTLEGLDWPQASVVVRAAEHAVRDTDGVVLPRCLVPHGWAVDHVTARVPWSLMRRRDLAEEPEFARYLSRALERLAR